MSVSPNPARSQATARREGLAHGVPHALTQSRPAVHTGGWLTRCFRRDSACFPLAADRFRENNFDFLRLALAVLVILSHSYYLASGNEDAEPLMRASRGQIEMGSVAVNFFFVISGFLITHSWLRARGLRDFLKRRVLRIYPAFVVAMLFCALVVAPIAVSDFPELLTARRLRNFVFQTITLNPFSVPGTFVSNPVQKVNGSMWTIRYEFWCYIATAALGLAGLLGRLRLMIALFLAAYVAYVLQSLHPVMPSWGKLERLVGELEDWPRFATYYLAGALFYFVRGRIPCSGALAGLCVPVLAASMFVNGAVAAVMPLCGTYLVFFFGFLRGVGLESFGRRGDFSYGTYLYAFPIQQLLILWMGPSIGPLALFALSAPLAVAAGFASWHLVEKHFRPRAAKRAAGGGASHLSTGLPDATSPAAVGQHLGAPAALAGVTR